MRRRTRMSTHAPQRGQRVVSVMLDPQTDVLLGQLRSREASDAWAIFLDTYSPLVLGVVRLFERDVDAVGDCYLFVCEQLSLNNFKRLLRFQPNGPASFSTWLRAVVRNLCLDWHRREFGRHRVFESVARMPPLEQEVFRALLVEGRPAEEAFLELKQRFPGLTFNRLADTAARVEQALSERQRWLLAVRRVRSVQAVATGQDASLLLEVPTDTPNPESWAALQEARSALARAMTRLSSRERLLIRLRFERDLTLEEIARVIGLDNAQSADRRVRDAVEKLRRVMK